MNYEVHMKYDVAALGELLIDFTENGLSAQGNGLFEANPGGAPCNVLAMLTKLGKRTAFIGKVGNDGFGKMLKSRIEGVGINADGLRFDDEIHTTLALVQTLADGDRDFSFYRNPGADMNLLAAEVDLDIVRDAKVFHFGTLSMTHDKVREATKLAIDEAKKAGAILSFDPNLREPLWDSLENAKEQVRYGLSKCDILKISDNEILWLTGLDDQGTDLTLQDPYTEGVRRIREEFNIPLILVSLGKEGSRAYLNGTGYVEAPAFVREDTIETTGAGDTFCACVISYVLDHGLDLSDENLREMLTFANAAASIVTTRKGALCVMPDPAEIQQLLHCQASSSEPDAR